MPRTAVEATMGTHVPGSTAHHLVMAPTDEPTLDLGYFPAARESLAHIRRVLQRGEEILTVASGFLEGRTGIIAATTERLLFIYKDQTPINAKYSEIAKFRARTGLVTADLLVVDGTGQALIKQIHPRSRLPELARVLAEGPGKRSATQPDAPAPRTDTAGSRTDSPGPRREASRDETGTWRPVLKPKISPLPARPAPQSSKLGERSDPPAPPTVDTPRPGVSFQPRTEPMPLPTTSFHQNGSWRPAFHEISNPRTNPPQALRRVLPPDPKGVIALAAGSLDRGEWLLATFPTLQAARADKQYVGANAAVTNSRVLLIGSAGAVVEAWGLAEFLPASEADTNIVYPDSGGEIVFTTGQVRRDFASAVGAATGIPRGEPSDGR